MIKINITNVNNYAGMYKPIELFGAEHGEVYRQYFNGRPQETYLIGAGLHDRPIMIWYDDEDECYRLSSQSKKDLKKQFCSVVYYHLPDAQLTINLELA